MNILDRWIVDLQLVDRVVHLELRPGVLTPSPGGQLITERYGVWETLYVAQSATSQRGATVAVKLIQTDKGGAAQKQAAALI